MSVLNQSGEEQVECPLCMEPLEVDDLNFYPCTCGYQICRFCWHRIRTDENGLCPACRKAYSENPADFTPLSKEQVAQLKAEKRQRDQQRKAKLSESRKHLASVRVVQKNLVFVVGLPIRLADAEVLKRHEYFGKFGKIHKVVINQSTSYAGSQGPSASAYVTYMKSDDALRAIQNVNNITIDGRLIKSSLGTTKYCSHFMKNQPCPKPDCMYLHDFGDPEASFTKEQMHAGKHQEYEKKLHDALQNRTQLQQQQQAAVLTTQQSQVQTASELIGSNKAQSTAKNKENGSSNNTNRDSWPQLSSEKADKTDRKMDGKQNDKDGGTKTQQSKSKNKVKNGTESGQKRPEKKLSESSSKDPCSISNGTGCGQNGTKIQNIEGTCNISDGISFGSKHSGLHKVLNNTEGSPQSTAKSKESSDSESSQLCSTENSLVNGLSATKTSALPLLDDNSSFFSSQNSFQKIVPDPITQTEDELNHQSQNDPSVAVLGPHPQILTDSLPDINSTEDWEAAFGFSSKHRSTGQSQLTVNAPSNSVKDALDSFGNNFGCSLGSSSQLGNRLINQGYNSSKLDMLNGYELGESLMEALSKSNLQSYNHQVYKPTPTNNMLDERLIPFTINQQQNHVKEIGNNGMNGLNGMDHMSKFFSDFYKNGQKQDLLFGNQVGMGLSSQQNGLGTQQNTLNGLSNGLNGLNHHHHPSQQQNSIGNGGSFLSLADKQALLLMQHQRQIEEQLMNLNLKHQQQQQQQSHYGGLTNGIHGNSISPFLNGTDLLQNGTQSQPYGNQNMYSANGGLLANSGLSNKTRPAEDELDFDPILETQKALAEIIQSEQQTNIGLHNSNNRSSINSNHSINGMVHNQNSSNSHCPPPPGFVQQNNTHMNSFGSKILPFLNMGSSQQQPTQHINNSHPQNNWPGSYGQMPQQQQPHKTIGVCNDWKLIDPAIVRSSKQAFPISGMGPLRDQFNPLLGMQNGPTTPAANPFDSYGGNAFSNFSQQIQQQNFNFLNSPQHQQASQQNGQLSNWLGASDLVGPQQISSPPGFRNTQTAQSKQQEC